MADISHRVTSGKIVATERATSEGATLYDSKFNVLARYNKNSNATFTANGTKVANGNCIQRFIPTC